eukprot:snap_masked-scaffold_10-processed-gene-13.14-mRNA-1 protein AED:1.00 eAED:1.00 QI:0/0/0/0/1/1/2/0/181
MINFELTLQNTLFFTRSGFNYLQLLNFLTDEDMNTLQEQLDSLGEKISMQFLSFEVNFMTTFPEKFFSNQYFDFFGFEGGLVINEPDLVELPGNIFQNQEDIKLRVYFRPSQRFQVLPIIFEDLDLISLDIRDSQEIFLPPTLTPIDCSDIQDFRFDHGIFSSVTLYNQFADIIQCQIHLS